MESNSDIQSNAIPHSMMGMNQFRSMLSEREQSQIRKVAESTVHRQLPEGGAKERPEAEIKKHTEETLGIMVTSINLIVGIVHRGCQTPHPMVQQYCTA